MNAGGVPNTCKSNEFSLMIGACTEIQHGTSGGRVSNAWVTCPVHTDNIPKGMLIRDNIRNSHVFLIKAPAVQDGPASD